MGFTAISIAENYLINKFGQSYYGNYISFYGGESYKNSSYVYFAYKVPFSNSISKNSTNSTLGINLAIKGNNVTRYIGPTGPYIINITAAKALNISYTYGIQNGTARIVGAFDPNVTTIDEYSVAWAVSSPYFIKDTGYPGIYVDAGSGYIIGQYAYNPNVNGSNPNLRYGTAGDFSIFDLNSTGTIISTSGQDSAYVIPLAVTGIVLFAVLLYISRRIP